MSQDFSEKNKEEKNCHVIWTGLEHGNFAFGKPYSVYVFQQLSNRKTL